MRVTLTEAATGAGCLVARTPAGWRHPSCSGPLATIAPTSDSPPPPPHPRPTPPPTHPHPRTTHHDTTHIHTHAAPLPCWCSHPEFEQQLAAAGIDVVPSRCLKVDRAAAGGRSAL